MYRVLIVDDEPIILNGVYNQLQNLEDINLPDRYPSQYPPDF